MTASAEVLDLVAVMATSFFAGAAVYVMAVEQPARMQLPVREAARQFGKSYPRAAILQPIYVLASCAASAMIYFGAGPESGTFHAPRISQQAHLVNLLLMGGCLVLTIAYMLPGNKAILAAEGQPTPTVKKLLQGWGWNHALRSVPSTASVVVLLAAKLDLRS